jgi:tellurite resistance protein TerC
VRAPDNAVNKIMNNTLRKAKRLITAVVGFTVLFAGIAMIILPGPAVVVIPAGLAILASEFVWARQLLKKAREKLGNTNSR